MPWFEDSYNAALASKLLPGAAILAGNKKGETIYSKTFGVRSSKPDTPNAPFELNTICAIASCTKLLTSIAAMQCVEDGVIELDEPVSGILPDLGKYGVMKDFSEESGLVRDDLDKHVTLRMLLSHTSGHEYDWFNPKLGAWRRSRGEEPWVGPTVEIKSSVPLQFQPGAGWAYGQGHDWAGRFIERKTGKELEQIFQEKIFGPLGLTDASFYPSAHPDLLARMADLSTLIETPEGVTGPAVDASAFDITMGGKECLGGGGLFASPAVLFTVLKAVLARDERLLKNATSWAELFKPQLNREQEQALNAYCNSSPMHQQFIGMGIAEAVRKNWSFAGLVCLDPIPGRSGRNMITWGGVPCIQWYLDFEAGLCGLAVCQVLPPMTPGIMALHQGFQSGIYNGDMA